MEGSPKCSLATLWGAELSIGSINENFAAFIGVILNYAILLAASGTLAMALIEAVKGLSSAKARFHQDMVRRWLADRFLEARSVDLSGVASSLEEFLSDKKRALLFGATSDSRQVDGSDSGRESIAFLHLQNLCNGLAATEGARFPKGFQLSDELAFYSLETDQMVAKIQQSLEWVLQHPSVSPVLFLILASQHTHSALEWLKYLKTHSSADNLLSEDQQKVALQHQDALAQLLNNKLDSFQVNVLYAWGRMNRFAAISLGALLLFVFFLLYVPEMSLVRKVLFASLGGMVSPVCKDLVTAIKGVSLK
jgi:hypothetical protein